MAYWYYGSLDDPTEPQIPTKTKKNWTLDVKFSPNLVLIE